VIDVKRGAAIQVDTANGLALGYQTRLNTVRLGDIVVHEVSAVFSDGMMDDTVLLGMSFLKHVEFTQRANQLTLRAVR
jgi:aspartyl protease family protein